MFISLLQHCSGQMKTLTGITALQYWDRGKRLGSGMLVCLWMDMDDGTTQLVFATVCKRDTKELARSESR